MAVVVQDMEEAEELRFVAAAEVADQLNFGLQLVIEGPEYLDLLAVEDFASSADDSVPSEEVAFERCSDFLALDSDLSSGLAAIVVG